MKSAFLAAVVGLAAPMAVGQEVAEAPGAVLRGLDKVTGVTTDLSIPSGQSASFGRLTVAVSECRYPVGDPSSNAYAHITVTDPSQDTPVFDGWMIATSPAISALDHPRYDVWIMRCMSS